MEQNNETNLTGIADAVLRAGSQTELANKIGVSQQVISKWLKRGFVPLARVVEIEAEYGIPRARLANPRLTSLVDSGVE